MIKKYVKKPLVVEALKWNGNNRSEVFDFCSLSHVTYEYGSSTPKLVIQTLEGPMTASVGDYIIKGIKNEFYACKPDVFKLTYDSVEE